VRELNTGSAAVLRLGASPWFGGDTLGWADAAAARMSEAADAYAFGERRREYRDHRLERLVKSGGREVVLAGLRNNSMIT
jgi:hypothetical protein